MNLVAAILIFGATGHAERSMETDTSVARIVAQCGAGLFHDARLVGSAGGLREKANGFLAGLEAADFRLTIDGQPRDDWRSWGAAGLRVAGYIADWPPTADRSGDSSTGGVQRVPGVGIVYHLRLRGYDITTETAVSDNRVEKTIDAWWTERVHVIGGIYRNAYCFVQINIEATERDGTTFITLRAAGTVDTSEFKCPRIRRKHAEPQASEQLATGLPEALRRIETSGRQFYAGGSDIADALDAVRIGLDIGRRMRNR